MRWILRGIEMMKEIKPFEIRLCKKGQQLLDAYHKERDKVRNKNNAVGKAFVNYQIYSALKKYVDHRNTCNECWDSRQGEINE